MATSLNQTGTVVVGYFSTGHEAHRAINALIDEGFSPNEIGAAFHVGAPGAGAAGAAGADEAINEARQPNIGGGLRADLGTTMPSGQTGASTTFGAAASDSTAVQPGVIGSGAGTQFGGAGRPGPITGSDLTNSGLPSELKSSLPHDPAMPVSSGYAAQQAQPSAYSPEPTHTQHVQSEDGWLEKVKHIFGMHHHDADTHTAHATHTPKAPVTKESQDFGTGEGHLMLNERPTGKRYSQPAFERSFTGYGIQPDHARHLSHRIGQGGAIVTVHAATRSVDAERVLEAHGGEVRFTGAPVESSLTADSQIETFGTVDRSYTGSFD